jgi:polygalacturonase
VESVTAQNSSVLSARHSDTFDVRDYGAKGDGKNDDTLQIQAAFDAIMKEGHGQLVFPEGKYIFGPIKFTGLTDSLIRFHKGAELYLLDDPKQFDKYNGGEGHPKWIDGSHCNGLVVEGGKFYGNSAAWPKPPKNKEDKRPGMFKFNDCNDFEFHGAEIYDTPHGNIAIGRSNNVYIHDVKVQSRTHDENSANTICIGLGDVTNAVVANVDVQGGDDSLKIAGESSNVTFKDSKCKGGHGLSVGSDGAELKVKGVTFSNIDLLDMTIGARFKITAETEGFAKDITWEHIRMTNVKRPISIHTSYNADNKPYKTKKFEIGDLYYSDIKAKYDNHEDHKIGGNPSDLGMFACDSSAPCKKLHLTDITISGSDAEWSCNKAKGSVKNVSPKLSCLSESDLVVV